MKALFLFLILLFSFSLKSQSVMSSCAASPTVTDLYRKDADRLALRREYHINMPEKDSVKINTTLRHNYLSALLAVYNATAIPARDTVINLLNIHSNPTPELNGLLIFADGGNFWMQSLLNSAVPTGYAPLDNLMSQYHLDVQTYYMASQYDVAVLRTDSNSNISAMAPRFAALASVLGASASAASSDVKNITDSINPAFTLLTYSFGWGSCENGCDFRAYWTFKVYNDCKVEYVGASGNPLVITGLAQQAVSLHNLQVYPNPAQNQLSIAFDQPQYNTEISLINALGQQVLHSSLHATNSQSLDLRGLPSGLYYLQVKDAEGMSVVKVVKE